MRKPLLFPYTQPDRLITDLKSGSSVPNALLGINHLDKPNDLSGTGIIFFIPVSSCL